jgi:hypothetical protein
MRINHEKLLEPLRRQGGITRRSLYVAVTEVRLDRAGIVAVIGELVATGMAEHVGVRLPGPPPFSSMNSTPADSRAGLSPEKTGKATGSFCQLARIASYLH